MNENKKTSVIVVGAGPVGLGLACDLGQRGVDCILIEKRDGAINVPKQSMVSARNMEFCRRWGVAKTVRTAVWPESFSRDFVYLESMRGNELLRFKVPAYVERDKRDFTPETACPCPQIYFDPILGNHARTLPSVTLAYNTRLDNFRQDADGVTAQVTDMATGAARTLRAQYLVGCDGPSGLVRDALGIGIEGAGAIAHSVNLFFRSADLATSHDKGWARFYRVIDETGCWAELIPIDGKELWRLTVFDEPLSKADPDFLLRKMTGGPFPYEMISVSPWERRDYVAQELRTRPHLHCRRRRARMLADRRHRHAHRARRGGQSRLEARRHGRRLGRTGAARVLRNRAAADRRAQCLSGDAVLQRHRRHPRMAGGRDGLESQSGLAVGARARQAAIRLRRLADLRARRHACAGDGHDALRAIDPAGDAGAACLARRRPLDPRSVRRRFRAAAARRQAARCDAADRGRHGRAACPCGKSPSPNPTSPRSTKPAWSWCGRMAMSPGAATNALPMRRASWTASAVQNALGMVMPDQPREAPAQRAHLL